jgi:glycosyltransferase involved in cell wall biosynthesis
LERIVLELIRAAYSVGQRVSVLCVEKPGALAAEANRLGANIISLDKPPGRRPDTVRKAAAVLISLRPDVIHTHQVGALWYVGQAARSVGRLAVVHTEHGNHIGQTAGLSRLKTRLFLHRSARFADRFFCVSEEIAKTVTRWRTIPRGKVAVVLNGIDISKFAVRSEASAVRQELGIPASARVIGTVGRLSEVKRQELLLRATAHLREQFPDLWLLLVGDGPERARLERDAANLGIGDRVCFAGYRSNPERFLQAMDLFALTSRSEGLPVSLLEAWASGLPVVCSAVGGIPMVVTSGEDGVLFPSGDEKALVIALAKVLGDRAFADRLAANGRKTAAEKYSLERMGNDYNRHYRDLLNTR